MAFNVIQGVLVDLSRFRSLLGDPLWLGNPETEWRDFEERNSLSLPFEYKEFVSAYGPGCLNDQMLIFHPDGDPDEGLSLDWLLASVHASYAALRSDSPELYPFPVHPDRGGLIPVGRSYGGNYLLLAPPAPDKRDWQVVVDMGEWASFDMSFTDFLWRALRRDIYLPVFSGEPSFELME
ncbi:SMI1/KNR4 family protein [Streptomyces sp. NPDC048623]|uniref:SMI1/KNR4 family protein n=1 Tax=Streptomyces sp. NPDC048623 TaxID=3155761 RepID=UPI00344A9725